MAINKKQLVDLISSKQDQLSHKDIELSVKAIFKSMSESLKNGNRIEIRGFGTFCVRDRKSIRARNPKSGESIELPKRSIPFFRDSKLLKQRVN